DLLIHVRDRADPLAAERKADVEAVLEQIGAGPEAGQLMVEAWNKIDTLPPDEREVAYQRARMAEPPAATISAVTGEGVDDLLRLVERALLGRTEDLTVDLGPQEGEARAWLYEYGQVQDERAVGEAGTMRLSVRLPASAAGRFRRTYPHLVSGAPREAKAAE